MRLHLIAVGSTGDVKPMITLGRELASRGHAVTMTAFAELRPLVVEAGLSFHMLPGDARRYIGSIIKPGSNPLAYLSRMESALAPVIDPLFQAIYDACQGADAIVATFFGTAVYAFAQALGVPLIQSNYCLIDITGDACLPMIPQLPLGRWYNRATYRLAYRMIALLEKRYLKPWCDAHGIAARSIAHGMDYQIGGYTVPVLYAFSQHVVARPPEWPQNIHIVGFWEDAQDPFTPEASLTAFLEAKKTPPLYIGFGSMTSGDMGKMLRTVLTALEQTGLRAVLAPGWSGMNGISLPDTVYILPDFVPHHWIFARVRAVVHHGGAGTTAASLYAGRPSLVIPFGSDQYFWADRIYALGCGPKALHRFRLNASRLSSSLRDLTSTEIYYENARQVQQLLLREDGAARGADIIEDAVHRAQNTQKRGAASS